MKQEEGASQKRRYRGHVQAEIAAATYRRILDAVLSLYSECWLDQITLEHIAERAEVTVQTIIRRFGTKEQLFGVAAREVYSLVERQRDETPVGDIDGAVQYLIAHYEQEGDQAMRSLAQEGMYPFLREFTDAGRAYHHAWVERVFAPFLDGSAGQERDRLVAALVAITEVYTWKILRRDMGLDREQTGRTLNDMLVALLRQAK